MKKKASAIQKLREQLVHDENAWDKVLVLIGDQAREIIDLKKRVRRLEDGQRRVRRRSR